MFTKFLRIKYSEPYNRSFLCGILTIKYLRSFITVWYSERHGGYGYRERDVEVFVTFAQVHAHLYTEKYILCVVKLAVTLKKRERESEKKEKLFQNKYLCLSEK